MQIAYTASDEVLVTGGYDQAIRLWDCRSRSFEPIQTLKHFGDSVTSVAVADRQERFHMSHCMQPLGCVLSESTDLPYTM